MPRMGSRASGKRNALRYYQKKNRRKLRAFNHDFPFPEYFRELIGDKKSISVADIGAGAIPTTGNLWPGVVVTIVASDLLADEYNEMWQADHRVILNPVTKQDMEHLTYPDNSFDIVHCVNALDHCENPRAAIAEMIRVCRLGGWVYLRHVPNEGEHQRYAGFHQWNIDKKAPEEDLREDDCVIWNQESHFLLSEFGNFTTEIKTEVSNTMYPGEESVVSRLRK
jgi:SAM-dependent methyltransferase